MPDFTVVNSEVVLRSQCETFLCAPAILFGKETIADAMADDALRAYFGRTLKDELMEHMKKDGRDEAVILACRALETRAISPLCDGLTEGLLGRFKTLLLPCLSQNARGLCYALACTVMLFCGAKRLEDGYEVVGAKGDKLALKKDMDMLRALSRLSCDMPADTLAYAVLSDEFIWEKDLRLIPGFPEMLENILRDMQLTGPEGALKALW